MVEVELFYKLVEAKIRERHSAYLEAEKREPVPIDLPKVDYLPQGKAWEQLNFFVRCKLKKQQKKQLKKREKALKKQRELRVQVKLLRGYNAGVKMALKVLEYEFIEYSKREVKALKWCGK